MKRYRFLFGTIVSLMLTIAFATASAHALYTPGTYTGVSPNGKGGSITVEVTFTEESIQSVVVVNHNETAGISEPAIQMIPENIMIYQSLAVDAVAGATITSNAILEAVADAVAQADGDVAALQAVKVVKEKSTEIVDLHATVVVVGAGAAGMAAAMTASDDGAESVIMLEKQSSIGGNAIVSGGYCEIYDYSLFPKNNAGYKAAIEGIISAGPQNDGEAAVWQQLTQEYDDYLASGTDRVFDSVLYHAIDMARLEGSEFYGTEFPEYLKDFVSWFTEKTGVEWNSTAGIVGYTWPRWSSLKGYYSGRGYFEYFEKYIAENNANIKIYTGTPMTDLLFDDSGRVVGVVAVAEDGTTYNAYAEKGVILCTGGYAANRKMVKETDDIWGDLLSEDIITTNASGATGDGILIAQKYGAASALMDNTMLFPLANIHTGSTESIVGRTASLLIVNQEGVRFCDETADRYTISGAMLEQTNQMGYVISSKENNNNTADGKTQGGEDVELLIQKGELYRAETIDELAGITGIDADNLRNTIEAYNSMCTTYTDEEFGRTTFEADSEILTGPFFAYPCTPATHITIGGLVVDEDGCVIDQDSARMEGLYAAGEITVGNCGIDGSFAYGRAVAKAVMNQK